MAISDHTTYLNYAPAADRNKEAIWQVLKAYLPTDQSVLEVASGSGQHALFFTEQNPNLKWQCTELSATRDALHINLQQLGIVAFPTIKTLDLLDATDLNNIKKIGEVDRVYTANTFHIISWEACLAFTKLASEVLAIGGLCIIYGPFFYDGQTPVQSNIEFDQALRANNPTSGIRSFPKVKSAFESVGMALLKDHAMPANNRLLVFQKS